jgi:hypothetical protein
MLCRYSRAIRFKVQSASSMALVYKISAGDVALMKYTIFTSGPVASGFDVYRDFMDYRAGSFLPRPIAHMACCGNAVLALQECTF